MRSKILLKIKFVKLFWAKKYPLCTQYFDIPYRVSNNKNLNIFKFKFKRRFNLVHSFFKELVLKKRIQFHDVYLMCTAFLEWFIVYKRVFIK